MSIIILSFAIERRDTVRYTAQMKEEEAPGTMERSNERAGIDIIYALSPAAKGKIERPYRWLQDHLYEVVPTKK